MDVKLFKVLPTFISTIEKGKKYNTFLYMTKFLFSYLFMPPY